MDYFKLKEELLAEKLKQLRFQKEKNEAAKNQDFEKVWSAIALDKEEFIDPILVWSEGIGYIDFTLLSAYRLNGAICNFNGLSKRSGISMRGTCCETTSSGH